MSLAELLSQLHRFDELPVLAHGLGFEPTWHEVSLGGMVGREPALGIGAAALIGRKDGFICLGVATEAREAVARQLTRAMASRGKAGLVLAFDPSLRMLTIAVAAGDCPQVAVDLASPAALDLKRLERGTAAAASGLERAMRWLEALSSEGLSTRFFLQFRRALDRTVLSLPHTMPARDRHALGLLQLTRVLFLYFVQHKGWLDGRDRFLREELDRTLGQGGRVHRRLLVPLFFGTLNRPAARRSRLARGLGRIPFLNGGLFEPHALERRWPVEIPDAVWRDLFDDLFERFHFTLGDSADGRSIGPDMLGRVFEGVMNPEERRHTGAFYTPRSLVDRVVGAAFDSWADALGVGIDSPEARAAADHIAVLDPAVGSGAFLLGALERLVSLKVAGGQPDAVATRSVVTANLFGVDRNPNAVRLAELRLWLLVIEAEESVEPERVDPLPNLDACVRQGDSLIEPRRTPAGIPALVSGAVARHRLALANATGPAKRELARELRRSELAAAHHGLSAAIEGVERSIRELVELGQTPGLFDDAHRLGRRERAELARLRADRARLRRLHRRIRDHDELPWFHYESQFADIMARGGFDLVLGNPPWIRAESIPKPERAALKARYRWYRAGRSERIGYGHQPDLSVAFLERALELARPGGTVGFVLPSKLLTARYGAVARGGLAREGTIVVLADLAGDETARFDATVYPMALVVRRGAPPAGHRFRAGLPTDAARLPQAALGDAPWSLSGVGPLGPALGRHPTIAERFRCQLGVKTGADHVYLAPPAGLPPDLVRPALRGRDLSAFSARPATTLLWTHDADGAVLGRLPGAALDHVARHEKLLRRRADYRDGPYWQVFRTRAAVARHRVVWPDLARRLEATALIGRSESAIPLNTCYVMVVPDRPTALRMAAWLNGTAIRELARERATVAASGFARFNAGTVGSLPLPDAAVEDDELERLAIRAHRGEAVQAALDARVDRLLGLG